MEMKEQNLSSGLEDYIETIYLAQNVGVSLKAAELARRLNISRASVSEALSKLISKKLIEYKSYGNISLTKLGEAEAKKVYTKHSIIKNFFETVLNIESDSASKNACKIEHIISEDVLNAMKALMNSNDMDRIK